MRSNNNGPTPVTHMIKHETFAARSFKYSAHLLWNHLPEWLREESLHEVFKKELKHQFYSRKPVDIYLTYFSTLNKP